GADLARLVRRYEREVVLPLPHGGAAARFARQINPSLAVLLGPDNAWRRGWQQRIAALDLPVETLAPGDGAAAAERLAARLPIIPLTREVRESLRRPSRLARFVLGPIGRHALDLFSHNRIRRWDELAQDLGRPRRILCLGNGPSSEDPALQHHADDALFR